MKNFSKVESYLVQIAHKYLFVQKVLKEFFFISGEWREILRQCYLVGYRSLLLLGFVSFIGGFVFTKQSEPVLTDVGQGSLLPGLVSIGIIRSLGPLITALVSSGKLGSSIGAELSSMNVTEQIDAMDVSGINPFRFLVVTRVLAVTLMIPILSMYSNFMALLGGYVLVNTSQDTSFTLYFIQVFDALVMQDLYITLIKPIFFGLGIGLVSTYCGYYSSRDTVAVGSAANKAVVFSMVSMFIVDFIVIQVVQVINSYIP